uniref:Type II toxin-antitoxin system RelE/ParE family toxin n=1 Tax=Elaeophora elaphi TaxID=1147741 RepID=A0A0R3RIZ7_9BILA
LARLVFLVNDNRLLQYYTLGYSIIISSKQKTGLLKL